MVKTNETNFQWKIYNSRLSKNQTDTYSDPSSRVMQGSFLYISETDSKGEKGYGVSKLVGRQESFPWTKCVKFKYRMYGPRPGRLAVSVGEIGSQLDQRLFDKTGNQGEAWQQITVQVDWKEKQALHFTAYRHDRFQGEIALDDIKVKNRRCPKQEVVVVGGGGRGGVGVVVVVVVVVIVVVGWW
ncbi:MAM domain-containing glycosylphosphatidylinositol anchor protein 1 [Elysia marginata]|uniref:MAM domain-containing glycosylphosphatidylinositol anchor protein 1 n=1 Tax=Elysia marginata TaxID=1093978 RepID=A0AAV4IQJ2_9GAST|nr:MAM domain-containing glycosylphosphatidylinositol anchor protein 1 [Elysia marginata]